MGSVTRFCDRALLLERGRVVDVGKPDAIAQRYLRVNFPQLAPQSSDADRDSLGARAAYVTDTWFEDEHRARREFLEQSRSCMVHSCTRFTHPVDHPSFAFVLKDQQGTALFVASTGWTQERTGSFAPGDEVVFEVGFENLLVPGRYYATVRVAERGSDDALIDERDRGPRWSAPGHTEVPASCAFHTRSVSSTRGPHRGPSRSHLRRTPWVPRTPNLRRAPKAGGHGIGCRHGHLAAIRPGARTRH